MGAKVQLLEVVTGHSQFLSHFSILDLVPQAMPTQPVNEYYHAVINADIGSTAARRLAVDFVLEIPTNFARSEDRRGCFGFFSSFCIGNQC